MESRFRKINKINNMLIKINPTKVLRALTNKSKVRPPQKILPKRYLYIFSAFNME